MEADYIFSIYSGTNKQPLKVRTFLNKFRTFNPISFPGINIDRVIGAISHRPPKCVT